MTAQVNEGDFLSHNLSIAHGPPLAARGTLMTSSQTAKLAVYTENIIQRLNPYT